MAKAARQPRANPRHLYRMAIGDGGAFVAEHQELTYWLGAISVQWAGLEAATFHLFNACSGTNILLAEVAFYSHRNSRARRELALATFAKFRKSQEQVDELTSIMRRIGRLGERRNDLIHHAWATDQKHHRPHRFGVNIEDRPSPESPKALQQLFERIDAVTADLSAFTRKHLYKLPNVAPEKKEPA
jgi:hypothetical protein